MDALPCRFTYTHEPILVESVHALLSLTNAIASYIVYLEITFYLQLAATLTLARVLLRVHAFASTRVCFYSHSRVLSLALACAITRTRVC